MHIASFALLIFLTAPGIVSSAIMPGPIVNCSGAIAGGASDINPNLPPCTICSIAQTAQNVLNTGIFVAVFLSAILFAWAGVKYLTSAVNSGGINEAKSLFGNVLIGLFIILGAWLVIDTLMKTLTNGQFGPWNKVC